MTRSKAIGWTIKFGIALLACYILIAMTAYADGVFFSDGYGILYSPDQKAVISWNGSSEEIILASSAKSQSLVNAAWIIPIASSTKPEIVASNITIFEDLADYFSKMEKPKYKGAVIMGGPVEVLESKKIDIYDITILKASDSSALIEWLNSNGYNVLPTAKPLLDKYVGKGNMYFIANKINLKNKYKDDLESLKNTANISREIVEEGERELNETSARLGCSLVLGKNKGPSYSALYGCLSLKVKDKLESEHIQAEIKNETGRGGYTESIVVVQDKWHIRIQISQGGGLIEHLSYSIDVYNNSRMDYHHLQYHPGDPIINKSINLIQQAIEENRNDFDRVSYIGFKIAIIPSMMSQAYNTLDNLKCPFSEHQIEPFQFKKLKEEPKLQPLVRLCYVKEDLRLGMTTPLKITFTPPQPYYPLEISGLGQGHAYVNLYVLSKEPMIDINNIMTKERAEIINTEMKRKLSQSITTENAEYVTQFTWNGMLEDLDNDVVFKEKKPNIWERIIAWFRG